ncbi:MAG: ElyC/SanA/YdcF family protein [Candidatus Absconditabacteria bacterium]
MSFTQKSILNSSNLKKWIKNFVKLSIIMIIITVFIVGGINIYIWLYSRPYIQENPNALLHTDIGLILGAAVKGDKLSDVLKDRVDSAIKLFHDGKFSIFLVSGDNGSKYYNEVIAIRKYLLSKGVPEEKIYLDYAGFDTYDSMYRAKHIFSVDKMIIFTQWFHLPRSVYIARRLGIDAQGYSSDLHEYRYATYYQFREIFSRIKAFTEVEITKSKSKFLGEKINIYK